MNTESDAPVRICHFSDLHLSLHRLPKIRQLIGKRALGYANLRFNRGRTHRIDPFKSLLRRVVSEEPDLVVVTGDLTSLALATEFEAVDRLFTDAGLLPSQTLILPGNHDRYTPGADWGFAFERGMHKWLRGRSATRLVEPQIRVVGSVVVIGLDTATWRGPVRAAGRINARHIDAIGRILDRSDLKGKWPVIAMHHPPFHLRRFAFRDYRNGLSGVDPFLAAIGHTPATLIHGHLHRIARRAWNNLDIIGVPSASNVTGDPSTQLAFNTYTFDKRGLVQASSTRHWPLEPRSGKQFESVPLDEEILVD